MALNYIKQKLTELPGEMHKSAFTVETFHLRVFAMINIIKQTKMNIDIFRALITGKYTFFYRQKCNVSKNWFQYEVMSSSLEISKQKSVSLEYVLWTYVQTIGHVLWFLIWKLENISMFKIKQFIDQRGNHLGNFWMTRNK